MLPQLLEGEDPDFVACIQRNAQEERSCVEAAAGGAIGDRTVRG
jgi:hypothetical protein